MPSTTRRRLLRVGGPATAATVGGCTDWLVGGTTESWLTFLLFHNVTDAPHDVTVHLENDGERLYEETVALDPHSTEVLPPDDVRSDGFPTNPGGYEATFRLDDRGRTTVDLGAVDAACVGYTAEVSPVEDATDPQLHVFSTTGCNQG